MRGRWNRKEYMKVCKEFDVLDGVENKQSGRTLYALKATGNYQIYEDDGELIDTTDEDHVQALIHYYKLRKNYEGQDAVRS